MKKQQMEQSLSTSDPFENSKLPHGWKVESLADGSLRVMPPDAGQTGQCFYITIAIILAAVLLFSVALAYGLVPGKWEIEGFGPGWDLLPLLPFALFALLLVMSAFNDGHEWIVSHNRLEFRWGGKSPNFRKSHLYTDGKFKLRHYSVDGSGYWQLDFRCPNGWMNRGCISKSTQSTAFEELHYLGSILSAKTGWPLKPPSEINGKNQL